MSQSFLESLFCGEIHVERDILLNIFKVICMYKL